MKVSAFKIGFVLVVIGMIWISVIFNETEKNHDSAILKKSSSMESKLEFLGEDIGYYKVYMPEFTKENVFVQILDKNLNVIQVSNISENSIFLETEFGNTHSQKMIAPGIMIVLGSVIIMLISYLKIKNYNIEHPDENIS